MSEITCKRWIQMRMTILNNYCNKFLYSYIHFKWRAHHFPLTPVHAIVYIFFSIYACFFRHDSSDVTMSILCRGKPISSKDLEMVMPRFIRVWKWHIPKPQFIRSELRKEFQLIIPVTTRKHVVMQQHCVFLDWF